MQRVVSTESKRQVLGGPIRWDYEARWETVRRMLARRRADAFVVRQPGNIRYLACAHVPGNPPLSAVVIPRQGSPVGISSSMEATRAVAESALPEVIVFARYRDVDRHVAREAAAFGRIIASRRLGRILADSAVPGVKAAVDPFVNRMREVKEPQELTCVRQSARLVSLAAAQLKRFVRVGRTELEVAAELEYFLRRHGAQDMSYPTIVAAGPHASYSHHVPTARKIQDGDAVICDYGVHVNGYSSDITRTIRVGRGNRWNEIYDAVRAAQAAAAKQARPGVPFRAVDDAARGLLRRRGLAKAYVHSTGHGLGLETHEGPSLSPFSVGTCRPGMVVTIEPGVYLSGQGGVRIEDALLITETGVEWLTGPVP